MEKETKKTRKLIDIAVNLTDGMFKGQYNNKSVHVSDLDRVLQRAQEAGVEKMMITGGTLEESREALKLARSKEGLYSTVGVHPTRCQEFLNNEDAYMENLLALIKEGGEKVVAVGEFGLDYDRLQFCPKEVQQKYFAKQFTLAEKTKLPLFLHMRAACEDFIDIVSKHRNTFDKGVVHSFTGTKSDAQMLLSLGLYIGINGCSLKTKENLEVIKEIPNDRILIETDAPWCDVRKTHAGYQHIKTLFPTCKKEKFVAGQCVQNRSEPCHVVQVLEIIAGEKKEDVDKLAETIYQNTVSVFFPPKK